MEMLKIYIKKMSKIFNHTHFLQTLENSIKLKIVFIFRISITTFNPNCT